MDFWSIAIAMSICTTVDGRQDTGVDPYTFATRVTYWKLPMIMFGIHLNAWQSSRNCVCRLGHFHIAPGGKEYIRLAMEDHGGDPVRWFDMQSAILLGCRN